MGRARGLVKVRLSPVKMLNFPLYFPAIFTNLCAKEAIYVPKKLFLRRMAWKPSQMKRNEF